MNRFNDQDLVTVLVDEPTLWYTYMDVLRKEYQGRTGRVMRIETQVLNKEDLSWYFLGRDPKETIDKVAESYEQIEYSYLVRFTDCKEIIFTEKHLQLFVA